MRRLPYVFVFDLDGTLFGPVAELSRQYNVRRYVATLTKDLKGALGRGEDMRRAADTAAASERGRWRLFDDYNARNASAAYAEYEWDP